MRDMTDKEISEAEARLYDAAEVAAANLDVKIATEISSYSLKDFSQLLEDAARLNTQWATRGDYTPALVQLRTCLAARFLSSGRESEAEKLVRDQLISEAVTEICEIVGVE